MTIAANATFSFPATLGGFAGQDDGSPSTSLGDVVSGPVTNAGIASKATQETAFTGIPAALAALLTVGVSAPIIQPQAALPAGLCLSHTRVSAAGVAQIAHANLTAGALGTGALSYQSAVFSSNKRHKFGNPLLGVGQTLAVGGYGTIGTLTAVEGTIAVAGQANAAFVVVSPNGALPAGLFVSHARTTAGNVLVALGNATGGGVTPGNVSFDVVTFTPNALSVAEDGQNGPYNVMLIPGLTATFGSIAAATLLEATTSVSPLSDSLGQFAFLPGDVVHVSPRSALPNVGLAVSHGRVSAQGVLQIGLYNLTAGAIVPGAVIFDAIVFRPVVVS